jgi:hypothetical protein
MLIPKWWGEIKEMPALLLMRIREETRENKNLVNQQKKHKMVDGMNGERDLKHDSEIRQ